MLWHSLLWTSPSGLTRAVPRAGRERVATLWEAAEEGQTTDDGAPAREELTAIGSFEGDGDGGGPQQCVARAAPR